MFVHLIQFEVTDGLDLGLLDEGAHITLGLSRSSRLWTRFLRGSGEHPVGTSGDLQGEPQWEAKGRVRGKFEGSTNQVAPTKKSTHCFLEPLCSLQLYPACGRGVHWCQTELFNKLDTSHAMSSTSDIMRPPDHNQWLFFLSHYFYFRCLTRGIVPV